MVKPEFRYFYAAVTGICLLILAACATPPLNRNDPAFPAGTVMSLNQPVNISAGQVGGYIRGGGSTETRQQYETTCRLETRTVQKATATIDPDQFEVLGTSHDRDGLSGSGYSGGFGGGFYSIGDGPGLVYVNFYIYLQSVRQPDVFRLKCSQLQDDYRLGTLSPQQIEYVLGNAMTVQR